MTGNRLKLVLFSILGVILVLLVVTWLNLSYRPDVYGLSPDSGFYAYIGKALLHGQVLYRDVWDDKPPLGYYLNAAALAVFGQTSWGLWWSIIVWISACLLLFFSVINKLFGAITAWLACVLFALVLMNPELFQGGNLMEVYALAPQVGLIGVTYLFFTSRWKPWMPVLAGLLVAASYLIKQPTITIGCASVLVMVASLVSEQKYRSAIVTILKVILGAALLFAVILSYWLAIGALRDFIDGALLQGFSFIGGSQSYLRENFFYTLVNLLPKLLIGKLYLVAMLAAGIFLVEKLYQFWLRPLIQAGVSWYKWLLFLILLLFPLAAKWLRPSSYVGKWWLISICALGLFILILFYRLPSRPRGVKVFTPIEWTWLIAVISLPFEVLMASLGGRYFGHYFITMIPAVVVTLSYPIWRAVSGLRTALSKKAAPLSTAVYLIPALLAIGFGTSSFPRVVPSSANLGQLQVIFQDRSTANSLEQYIIDTTAPSDQVLVWHIHLGINFDTGRNSPARVLFPLNLFIPPSAANSRLQDFIGTLEANPPELIVVQSVSSLALPFVDQPIDLSCQAYCTPEFVKAMEVDQISQEWHRFQEFFYTHYALDTRIYDWKIYRRLP